MIPRLLLLIFLFTGLPRLGAAGPAGLLLITVDGLGWGDFAAAGNAEIPTPHLDRLLAESAAFRDFHVSPLDAPSRAALLTGQEPLRLGIYGTHSGRNLLRLPVVTISAHLKAAGYSTGLFGVWGLGDNYPSRPGDHGYTTVLTHRGGAPGGASDFLSNDGADDLWLLNGEAVQRSGSYHDVCFGFAQDFIDRAGAGPFFCHISPSIPAEKGADAIARSKWVAELDRSLGALMEHLGKQSRLDTTLIILTSTTGKHPVGRGRELGFNAGRRGARGTPYEGGHTVPLLVRWPGGGIAPAALTGLTGQCDVLPTVAALLALPLPVDLKCDGTDLSARLLRNEPALAERVLFTEAIETPVPVQWRQSCVLSGPWRLINGRELYDLRTDPGQRRDLSAAQPDMVQQLKALAEARWTALAPASVEPVRAVIGGPQDPVALQAGDWASRSSAPLTREDILRGTIANGQWLLHIASEGKYDIVLRRWPMTVSRSLHEGFFVPDKARIRIGTADQQIPVPAGAASVSFRVELKTGPVALQTWLIAASGQSCGAYYVECRKALEVRAAQPVVDPLLKKNEPAGVE
jgi:arylsulfatase A-like enzyme